MSTRVLGLLTTTTAVLALGAGTALAGPQPPAPPAKAEAPAPPAKAEAPAPPAKPSGKQAAADGDDLAACADGECEVVIEDGQQIKLDDKFGIEPIRVEITGSRVKFELRGRSSAMVTTVNADQPHASINFENVTLQPRFAKNGKLIVKVSHQDTGDEGSSGTQ